MSVNLGLVFGEPPQWVVNHPELRSREIVPQDLQVLSPYHVWRSCYTIPNYVVKYVSLGNEEANIYDEFHRLDPVSPNHTLPCDVIHEAEGSMLIMPSVDPMTLLFRGSLSTAFDAFHQVFEGLAFLHDHCYAHLDIYTSNLVMSASATVEPFRLEKGKIYIIDFGSAQRFKVGPGLQGPIEIQECHLGPPENMKVFDPYAFDVWCMGKTLERLVHTIFNRRPVPWIVRRYVQWVIGNERGCTGVCHCRPTAHQARRVAAIFRWIFYAARGIVDLMTLKSVRKLVSSRSSSRCA